MAVQSSFYNTDGATRTFPSTKHIPSKAHVAVWLKRVLDNVYAVSSVEEYVLVGNSIVFDIAPSVSLYSIVEIRVADQQDELLDSPSDIALVVAIASETAIVGQNIVAVQTNATNIAAIQATSANGANITTIATSIANVNTIAPSIDNVNIVAPSIANVNTTAASIANVNTTAGSVTNVNTVASSIANVNSVATTIVPNLAEILLADDNAIIATTQAGIATTQADIATTQAGIATTKAGEANTSATSSQLKAWESQAETMTAEAYATTPLNTFVTEYTSDGDGTFTGTVTTNYSALHWAETIDDANIMHKTGDETKAGTLTLEDDLILQGTKTISDTNGFIKPTGDSVLFTKASVSSITIPVGTKILAGANIVQVLTTAYTLSLNSVGVGALDTGTKAAGTDYYVYALEAGGFIVSANATNPTGYTTANSRKIGGFHYGVIPEAFTAINNITASDATKIAGINSYTFWDLKFMPVNGDPRGMFFANSKWYDLYLCNTDHHLYGTSAAGKTIAGGTILNGRTYPKIPLFYGGDGTVTYGTFTWFESAELGAAYGKEQLSYDEFVAVAYGVLEASSASTADTGVTQHLANYTSKFGMCMATGCQYIWSRNVFSDTSGTYVWQAITEGRGSVYSVGTNPKTALLGGNRDTVANSGSRASSWANHVWLTHWTLGARFACSHLVRA